MNSKCIMILIYVCNIKCTYYANTTNIKQQTSAGIFLRFRFLSKLVPIIAYNDYTLRWGGCMCIFFSPVSFSYFFWRFLYQSSVTPRDNNKLEVILTRSAYGCGLQVEWWSLTRGWFMENGLCLSWRIITFIHQHIHPLIIYISTISTKQV